MSEKLSGDVSSPPEFSGNLRDWIRDMRLWAEGILREHNNDIQQLYDTKTDKP